MKVLALKLLFSVLLFAACVLPLHAAELRGAWISSVHNLDWPTKGAPAGQQKAELVRLLDAAKGLGLTDVFLQVRPEGDALYRSSLEPWSRFLTGTQGKDPGWDPLAFAITEGKKRGIGIHAWLNPYRASVKAGAPMASNHMARKFSNYAYKTGSGVSMDPGSREVQDHVVRVVEDIIRRYDVAGVHFDDYFYPYPPAGGKVNFPDSKTYQKYRAGGGKMSLGDWRRDNVNRLIARSSQAVKKVRPDAKFGVSPFGIYTKGEPPTVKAGLDQYNEIFADPLRWMKSGWVDYIAPQLYWKEDSPQSFSELLKWWRGSGANPRGVPVYPGIAVYRITDQGWPAQEVVRQVGLSRTVGTGARGHIFFRMGTLASNAKGVSTMLKKAGY